MRTFEILLLVLNVLALLLSFKNLSMVAWLGVVGSNVLALVIHGIVEGFRYQLAFAYLLVPLLLVHAGAKASGMSLNVSIPKALTVIAKSSAIVLLALTSLLADALPVFTLPPLTGPYAVGIKYVALIDEDRTDPFLDTAKQPRALMVKVYYPAKPDDTKPFSRYFHASSQLTHAFARFYHMPDFLFDHLTYVKTYAKDDLEVSEAQPRYPVVLFSHGAGTTMEVGTSQSEDLASHGYIVVSIDHPYVSAATLFPDRIVTAREATTNFDTPEPAEPITQVMADDAKFIIEWLGDMNEGHAATTFAGKLDLDHIGVMGHSVGGAVAYNMALNDRRVKAAVNIDGAVYVTPKEAQEIAPFLMLANDRYHVQAIENRETLMQQFDSTPEGQSALQAMYGSTTAYEAAYTKAQQHMSGLASILKESGTLYTIEGSDHMKFIDMGLFIGNKWLRELLQIGGQTDPARCLEITQALTVAFFDQHLKGQSIDAVTSVTKTYPELKQVHMK